MWASGRLNFCASKLFNSWETLLPLSLSAWVPCRRKGEAANSPNSRDGYKYIILRDMQEICEHMGNDQVEHAIEFHLELRVHINDAKFWQRPPNVFLSNPENSWPADLHYPFYLTGGTPNLWGPWGITERPDDTLQLRRPGDVASEKAPAAEQKPLDIGFGELNQPSHTMPEPVRAHYIPSKPEVPDSLPTVCSFQCVSRKTCAVVRKVPGWCSWSDSKRVQSWACLIVFQGFYSHRSFSDIFSPDSPHVTHLRIPFWLWLPPAECEFNNTAAPYCAGCLKQYSFKGLRLASPSLTQPHPFIMLRKT